MHAKMNRIQTLVIGLAVAMTGHAVEVTTTAGQLHQAVNDTQITELIVAGSLNAADFEYIADSLTSLTALDLSAVTIEAYNDRFEPALGQYVSAADVIPARAFMGTRLQSVVLPSTVKEIAHAAFAGVPVTDVVLPEGLLAIDDDAFTACNNLTTVTLPASLLRVGGGAWAHCAALASVNVAEGAKLRVVGDRAFIDCAALTEVNFGAAIESLGVLSLAGTGLETIDLSGCPLLTTIGDFALVANAQLSRVAASPALVTLGRGALLYDPALNVVALNDGLTQVPLYAFAGSNLLTRADLLPATITTVGDYAFYNLDRTKQLNLPASVTHVGTRAMAGMTALETLVSDVVAVPSLGDEVWAGVDQSRVYLQVPDEAAEDYKNADQWLEFMFEKPAIPGDVNADGFVNAGDISCVVNMIAGLLPADTYDGRDDVNGDGLVNASDISTLVNIIAGIVQQAPVAGAPNTADRLYLSDLAIAPGQTRELVVNLDNARDYTSLQCDVELPEGLMVVAHSVAGTSRSQHLNLAMGNHDNVARVVGYSMQRRSIGGREGAVLTLTVKADRALAADAVIRIYNTVMVTGDSHVYYGSPAEARVVNTTGLDDVTAIEAHVYATAGTLHIDSETATTAIVAAMNGTFTQVDVQPGHNEWPMVAGVYVVNIDGRSHKLIIK